ncbi:MAG: hypothetical protein QM323_00330 [Acidobacteriota bacterium]|nr:hypothetical protein [Acidobacteriota bacterium]
MKALRTALITTTAALAVTAVAVAGGQRVTSPDTGATPPQPTTTQVAVCAPQGSAPKAGLVGLTQAQRAGSRRDAAPRCDGSRAQVRAKTKATRHHARHHTEASHSGARSNARTHGVTHHANGHHTDRHRETTRRHRTHHGGTSQGAGHHHGDGHH